MHWLCGLVVRCVLSVVGNSSRIGWVMSRVIGVFVSDIHIGACPVARSVEPCFFEAMARSLEELRGLGEKHKAPIVITGDFFDRYSPSAEIINFALANLPKCYGIYGNHDLPNHNAQEIHRSAYWTLVQAGLVKNLTEPLSLPGMTLHPFPWGKLVVPCDESWIDHLALQVAVVHKYVWEEGFGYPGADVEAQASKQWESLAGYDVAFFGDNHKSFATHWGKRQIVNCGTFFRRKSDEKAYKPTVALLHADGAVELHYLDVSQDLFREEAPALEEMAGAVVGSADFLAAVQDLELDSLDFAAAVNRHLDLSGASQSVRAAVLSSMGG